MSLLVFPDINVWLALTLRGHKQHTSAWAWYRGLPKTADLVFCRMTQLGLLRLLTLEAAAGEYVMNQREAWAAYDRWMVEAECVFVDEPLGLEGEFRGMSDAIRPTPQQWADAYLAAFAAARSMELVTFDKALSKRAKRAVLLRSAN